MADMVRVMVLYCRKCAWRSDVARGIGAANCPQCGAFHLGFISFDETERDAANAILLGRKRITSSEVAAALAEGKGNADG